MKLPFCYVCGRAFETRDDINRDHIPPESAFLPEDRENFPLLLPTHAGCNHVFNLEDELLAQLITLSQPVSRRTETNRLEIDAGYGNGKMYTLLTNVNLHEIVKRWVRAFHSALYQEPMASTTRFSIQTPLPSGSFFGNSIQVDPQRPQFKIFEERISLNTQLGLVDRIISNNGRMRYRCTWQRADDGRWFAIFQIDLYAWSILGDAANFSRRECVGSYLPDRFPPLGTMGSELFVSGK